MSPELLTGTRADIPEGRQRIVKIFDLKHVQAADLKTHQGIAFGKGHHRYR